MNLPDQRWNPRQYKEEASFVPDLGAPLLDLLAPKPGESILDLGCGDGTLTLKLLEAGCRVIGIDASAEMVAAARSLGLEAEVGDGRALPFEKAFDAVFSNAVLHWIREPQAVAQSVWKALRPGGRFVGEFGGAGNIAQIVAALEAMVAAHGLPSPAPWYFPTAQEYGDLLRKTGFEIREITLFRRPTPLPREIAGWLETFGQPYLALLPEREKRVAELVEELRPTLCDTEGHWQADYVRLRFQAVRPY